MRNIPASLSTDVDTARQGDFGRRDLWLFAPLVVIAAALPIAIVTVLSASLWFATHSPDRYAGATFASRFENVYRADALTR